MIIGTIMDVIAEETGPLVSLACSVCMEVYENNSRIIQL